MAPSLFTKLATQIHAFVLPHTTKLVSLLRASILPYTTTPAPDTSANRPSSTASVPAAHATTSDTTIDITSPTPPPPPNTPTLAPQPPRAILRAPELPHICTATCTLTSQNDHDSDSDGDFSPLSLPNSLNNPWTPLHDAKASEEGGGGGGGGWRAGYEASSGTIVRRKGRGEFKFRFEDERVELS